VRYNLATTGSFAAAAISIGVRYGKPKKPYLAQLMNRALDLTRSSFPAIAFKSRVFLIAPPHHMKIPMH
jgi:hypothetical protein